MREHKMSDTIKIYRWIIRHKWDVRSPTPIDALLEGCGDYKDKYVEVYRKISKKAVRWSLKHRLKKAESVSGFTNKQKVHLMFVLSVPVNEAFETILKNEGNLIELTDPERLITFFRSQDGSVERRATYNFQQDGSVSADVQQDDDSNDQEPIKKKKLGRGRSETVFPNLRATDTLRMLHWLGKHCEYITTPVSASIVCQCWLTKISETKTRKKKIQRSIRNRLEPTMKNPELLAGFTTEHKVQLLFVLSLPMKESFEDIVKHEGHEIELADPERLITYFRSRDGTIERRATLQLHQGIYEPPVILLDDDDDDNFNYEDMEIKQYYDPGVVIKEEPMDEFDPQTVLVKEEPIDDYYDGTECNQQYIKQEPVESPEAESSFSSANEQEPVEQPAPRVVLSICRSLKVLRASIIALRSPSLAETQNAIEEALEIHKSNANPVPITDIAVNLSSIIYLAMKGDPKNDEEEQISRKAYLQFLLQFVILLNSNELDKFQVDLEQKIDQLDDMAKIRLENVKNGLSTLLVAITA